MILSFEIGFSLGDKNVYFLTLVVLGELSETLRLENLLHEVRVFVGSLDKLLHVLTLVVEFILQVKFFIRSVNIRLYKNSLLFKHELIHDSSIWSAI